MAYEKQTWVTGETITASKLNHMEDGIAAGGASYDLVLIADEDGEGNPTLTGYGLSFDEIATNIESGNMMTVKYNNNTQSGNGVGCSVSSECYVSRTSETDYQMHFAGSSGTILDYSVSVYNDNKYENITVNYCYWTYVYNSDTKEYTFTFNGYVD